MSQGNNFDDSKTANKADLKMGDKNSDHDLAKLDDGIIETMAKRVGLLVGFLLNHSTFAFGFCATACAPVLYLLQPPLGLVTLAMGVGAIAGKLGKLLDKRLRT
jgi:hypothetical protein